MYFKFISEDLISIKCSDWSEDMEYVDNLRISIITKEFQDWLDQK